MFDLNLVDPQREKRTLGRESLGEMDRILSNPTGYLQRKILRQEDKTPERMFKWNGGATINPKCLCSLCKQGLDALESEEIGGKRSALDIGPLPNFHR